MIVVKANGFKYKKKTSHSTNNILSHLVAVKKFTKHLSGVSATVSSRKYLRLSIDLLLPLMK